MNENNSRVLDRVFAWFRASGVMRGDDRWIGGVCSGLAARLGWSPNLVRALMIMCTFIFGFGAALYAFAWLLLPDARDGRILAEELVSGHWDWQCLGAFVMLAVALFIIGAGWAAIVVAAVVLWAICQSSVRQQHGYGFGYRRQGPNGPYVPKPANGMDPVNGMGPGAPVPGPVPGAVPPASGPVAGGGVPQYGPAPYVAPSAAPSGSAGGAGAAGRQTGPSFPVNGSVPGPVPGAMGAPAAGAPVASAVSAAPAVAVAADRRRARRKPAGPFVVLLSIGLILLSGAVMFTAVNDWYSTYYDGMGVVTTVTQATIWSSAVCVALGVLLVALGAMGRRAGGLIPVALVAGFTACCMILASAAVGYASYDMDSSRNGYAEVNLYARRGESASENADGLIAVQDRIDRNSTVDYYADPSTLGSGIDPNMNYWVSDSSPQNMHRLAQGVHFRGDDYDLSVANIDLSKYRNWNYTSAGTNTYKPGCPAGQINLSVDDAHVYVTLPDGCPYGFGSNGLVTMAYNDSLGDRGAVVRGNGQVMNLTLPFESYSYRDDSMMKPDGYDPDHYGWQGDGKTDESSFLINYVSGISGKVTVRYASETLLPSYTEFVRQITRNDPSSAELTTKRHYDVQNGDAPAPGTSGDEGKKEVSHD